MPNDDFQGAPHTHGFGTIFLVLSCGGLAVGAIVGLMGSFTLSDPLLLLLFVPVAFACVGAYHAAECDRLRREWAHKTPRDSLWSAKTHVMEAAKQAHNRAANWQGAAFFFSIPAAFGTLDIFF